MTELKFKRGVGKPAFACGACERAKRRCDGNRPCARCVKLGKPEACVDSDASARRRAREGDVVPSTNDFNTADVPKANPKQSRPKQIYKKSQPVNMDVYGTMDGRYGINNVKYTGQMPSNVHNWPSGHTHVTGNHVPMSHLGQSSTMYTGVPVPVGTDPESRNRALTYSHGVPGSQQGTGGPLDSSMVHQAMRDIMHERFKVDMQSMRSAMGPRQSQVPYSEAGYTTGTTYNNGSQNYMAPTQSRGTMGGTMGGTPNTTVSHTKLPVSDGFQGQYHGIPTSWTDNPALYSNTNTMAYHNDGNHTNIPAHASMDQQRIWSSFGNSRVPQKHSGMKLTNGIPQSSLGEGAIFISGPPLQDTSQLTHGTFPADSSQFSGYQSRRLSYTMDPFSSRSPHLRGTTQDSFQRHTHDLMFPTSTEEGNSSVGRPHITHSKPSGPYFMNTSSTGQYGLQAENQYNSMPPSSMAMSNNMSERPSNLLPTNKGANHRSNRMTRSGRNVVSPILSASQSQSDAPEVGTTLEDSRFGHSSGFMVPGQGSVRYLNARSYSHGNELDANRLTASNVGSEDLQFGKENLSSNTTGNEFSSLNLTSLEASLSDILFDVGETGDVSSSVQAFMSEMNSTSMPTTSVSGVVSTSKSHVHTSMNYDSRTNIPNTMTKQSHPSTMGYGPTSFFSIVTHNDTNKTKNEDTQNLDDNQNEYMMNETHRTLTGNNIPSNSAMARKYTNTNLTTAKNNTKENRKPMDGLMHTSSMHPNQTNVMYAKASNPTQTNHPTNISANLSSRRNSTEQSNTETDTDFNWANFSGLSADLSLDDIGQIVSHAGLDFISSDVLSWQARDSDGITGVEQFSEPSYGETRKSRKRGIKEIRDGAFDSYNMHPDNLVLVAEEERSRAGVAGGAAHKRSRAVSREASLRANFVNGHATIASEHLQWLGYGAIIDDGAARPLVSVMELSTSTLHNCYARLGQMNLLLTNEAVAIATVQNVLLQARVFHIPPWLWLEDNVSGMPIDFLKATARILRRTRPELCGMMGAELDRPTQSHESFVGASHDDGSISARVNEQRAQAMSVLSVCLPSLLDIPMGHEATQEGIIERMLLQVDVPVIRVYYARTVCIPVSVYLNSSAAVLFGLQPSTSDHSTRPSSFTQLPGAWFGLQLHPDSILPHALFRIRACLEGSKAVRFRGKFVRLPSATRSNISPSKNDGHVFEAECTTFFEYRHPSANMVTNSRSELRCATYVFGQVTAGSSTDDDEMSSLTEASQLQYAYAKAIRKEIGNLYRGQQLHQVLRATNTSSLAEALMIQVGPS